MSMVARMKAKWDEVRTIPVCDDCGENKQHYIGGAYICRPCVARKIYDAREADGGAEARRLSAAVLASPEYRAMRDRLTILEIAVGNLFGPGEGSREPHGGNDE